MLCPMSSNGHLSYSFGSPRNGLLTHPSGIFWSAQLGVCVIGPSYSLGKSNLAVTQPPFLPSVTLILAPSACKNLSLSIAPGNSFLSATLIPFHGSLNKASNIFRVYSVEFCFLTTHTHTEYIDLGALGCMVGAFTMADRGSLSCLFPRMRNDEVQATRFGKYLQGKSGFILLLTYLSSSLQDTFGQIK